MEPSALPGFNICLRWLKANFLLDDEAPGRRDNINEGSIAKRMAKKENKMPVLLALIDPFISCCIVYPQS